MSDDEREKILNDIIEEELAMFMAAPEDDESPKRPVAFRLTRRMAHAAHDEAFLRAYLEDLREARKAGRNLTMEKYEAAEKKETSANPLVDEIIDAEMDFLEEGARLYPAIIKIPDENKIRQYMRGELSCLSAKSLEHYAGEMRQAKAENRNPVLERHNWLAKILGKPLLTKE